jgi:hypothetical protein
LTNTAVDLGAPGWDDYYGWGLINFGAAAAAAAATLPNVTSVQWSNNTVVVSANYRPRLNYSLWRTPQLAPLNWTPVPNAPSTTNGSVISLTDSTPSSGAAFYRVQASEP